MNNIQKQLLDAKKRIDKSIILQEKNFTKHRHEIKECFDRIESNLSAAIKWVDQRKEKQNNARN
jgi:uncharacterized protein YicC (UPF0701 family)